MFLRQHPALAAGACRFDVVAFEQEQQPRWIRNAFESPVV
jgi:Holliday junction resolvase-like predicted endonuclease